MNIRRRMMLDRITRKLHRLLSPPPKVALTAREVLSREVLGSLGHFEWVSPDSVEASDAGKRLIARSRPEWIEFLFDVIVNPPDLGRAPEDVCWSVTLSEGLGKIGARYPSIYLEQLPPLLKQPADHRWTLLSSLYDFSAALVKLRAQGGSDLQEVDESRWLETTRTTLDVIRAIISDPDSCSEDELVSLVEILATLGDSPALHDEAYTLISKLGEYARPYHPELMGAVSCFLTEHKIE